MNLADAQQEARGNPAIRAAVATSRKKAEYGAGITDDPDCTVELFSLVRDAQAFFKGQKELLEKDSFVVTYGTLSRGLLILEREAHEFKGVEIPYAAVSMSMVKRTTPRKGDGAT